MENENRNACIVRCLEGRGSENDQLELENWVQASPENLKYYRQIKNLWEISGNPIRYSSPEIDRKLQDVLHPATNRVRKRSLGTFLQRAAAILLLPLLAGSYFWGKYQADRMADKPHQMVYNEVFASYGTRSALSLSDGTRVWLNSGSSLKYPERFARGKREVYLAGEAYFEVKSDVSRPFLVNTRKVMVSATGTKFNVLASSDDANAEITLVSGKVSVNRIRNNKRPELLSALNPDDHMEYDTLTGVFHISRGDTYKYIAWKDGKLIFRNEPFTEVMDKLSRFYNVEIELRGEKLKEYRYRATFEEESFTEILKLLKLSSPVEYREIERLPLPDGTFPKRKVIIYARNQQLP